MSTAYHPQMDGVTERANRSVTQVLWSVVQAVQKDWIDKLPMMEFAFNANINETTGFAPFELDGEYMPSMIRELPAETVVSPGVHHFAEEAMRHLANAHDTIIELCVF